MDLEIGSVTGMGGHGAAKATGTGRATGTEGHGAERAKAHFNRKNNYSQNKLISFVHLPKEFGKTPGKAPRRAQDCCTVLW